MKKTMLLLTAFGLMLFSASAQISVQELRCENRFNPVGLDAPAPAFSWQIRSAARNTIQSAFEIRVAGRKSELTSTSGISWNSGRVKTQNSIHIPYAGKNLRSGEKYYWQVRIWDDKGKASAWSAPAFFQMALLNASDWKAEWILPAASSGSPGNPILRKGFSLTKKIASATAYITAHGLYEAKLNGHRIGDAYLTPGWTAYKSRLQYQVYDVTDMLSAGKNAIAVTLGKGWYIGKIGFSDNRNFYGKDMALLFQLEIKYTDGSTETVISDGSWKSSTGSIRSSEIYDGEKIDASLEQPGWTSAAFDDAGWQPVTRLENNKDQLVATYNEPIKKHEVFKPVHIFKTPKGEQVVDFGQNLVGWVKLSVSGKKGEQIILKHAEVLDKEGNFYTTNLRAAHAQDTFLLAGTGVEVFEPHFSFHGFRYIQIESNIESWKPDQIEAVTLYSDMQPTGKLETSDPMINQLQHNIQWGQKGNFLDVPTDCPQRDERLGWTGDAQVFSRTATFNMNVNNFFAKWLKDVAADQLPNGSVPFVVPNVLDAGAAGSTGWADVSTIIPWNVYLAYGDTAVLRDQYNSMKAWVEYMRARSRADLWNTGFHFGDWLFYRPEDDNDGRSAVTDKYLIAQCFYAHSTQLLINAAQVLGKTQDQSQYEALLANIKAAFMKEYVTPNGRLVSGTQTAYVLALNFDMLPESLRVQAAQRLAENVKNYDDHLTTGFLGTPYLCHVLSRFGYNDVAYALLMQKSYPSWLYPVSMGATTIWERWDGIKEDSTFQTPGMNSFNHYSYGAIGDWMYRVMAGIDCFEDGVGYRHIRIMPHPGASFSYVSASLDTYYGTIRSGWKKEAGRFIMDVEIPENTRASIYLPTSKPESITEAGKLLSDRQGLKIKYAENEYQVLETGSGKYHFEMDTVVKNK